MDVREGYIKLAIEHGKAWKQGNDKSANKVHRKLMKIKESGNLPDLVPLLNHQNESVRLWSAVFLLEKEPEIAMKALRVLEANGKFMSSTATIMIDMYQKGML